MTFDPVLTPSTLIAVVALVSSIASLSVSVWFWKKSFRPIVTAMVKTHQAGNKAIAYDLQIANSGSLPARNIRLSINMSEIESALGRDATPENKARWLCCFEEKHIIRVLQNTQETTCSFGTSMADDGGFWRYGSCFPITITYEGWFGKKYSGQQEIQVTDSVSFTGFSWS
ncbi:hypothetical protein BTW10_03815 [Chromohalobacter japonicus]|uniref:Uncharacterized protein n=1 Tax=Chromohalobacter japonicus TaxID=223900 RepID=A0A1Q8TFX6_9GAMM|nr:hypothetical protein [Chromohalobacter japonicus]OLO12599.1 hypothetical protein BTW10_03815 [Chromohalobacter japonicus]